jgi:glycosyltransferase involved in cell wall biosynthesis
MPQISVIIPTYNCAQYLPEAVDSVLAQTYSDYEIIVIDDGSTDNTNEVIKPYIERKLVRYIRQENGGPGSARNCGHTHSNGQFIAFLDSDDAMTPDSLEKRISLALSSPEIDFIFSDYYYQLAPESENIAFREWSLWDNRHIEWRETPYGRILSSGQYKRIFELAFYIWTGTVLYRKSALEKVGPFKIKMFGHEDTDMWLRFLKKCRVGYIDAPLAYYKQYRSNLTVRNPLKYAQDRLLFLCPLLNEERDNEIRLIIKNRLAWVYYDLATYYKEKGQLKESWLNYFKSIYFAPYNTYVYKTLAASILPEKLRRLLRKV